MDIEKLVAAISAAQEAAASGNPSQALAVRAAGNVHDAYARATRALGDTSIEPDELVAQLLQRREDFAAITQMHSFALLRRINAQNLDANGDNPPVAGMRARLAEMDEGPAESLLFIMGAVQTAAKGEYIAARGGRPQGKNMYFLGSVIADMVPLMLEQLDALEAQQGG